MGKPKSAVTKAVQDIRREADALDARRRHQIDNQIAIINRISDQGGYDDAMQDLVARLSETQAQLDEAKAENAVLRASHTFGYGVGQDT